MATVEFRGVMLFVCENGNLKEVVFPDTGGTPPGGNQNGNQKTFPDTSEAVAHYPGLIHVRENEPEKHYDLLGSSVAFLGGRERIACGSIAALPDLSVVTNIPTLVFDSASDRATTISMLMPAVKRVCVTHPKQPFAVPSADGSSASQCPLVVELTFDGELTMMIVDDAAQSTIRVHENERVILHNFDTRTPLSSDLTKEREIEADKNSLIDHDFKWLYFMCDPKPGDIKWGNKPLPAPEWKRPQTTRVAPGEVLVVSVSTCFPGRIGA
jgi:hypothetical protein